MKQGADTLKRVHFELGGKNPIVVFDDADLERALDAVVFLTYSLNGERLQEAGLSYRDIHESGSNLRSLSGNTAETRYIDKCGWCYHYNPFSERDMVRPWYTISNECAGPFTSANNGPPNYRIPSGENI